MSILVTGAAGYIGSHASLTLLESGYDVIALDNLSNASRESLTRVERLSGRKLLFISGDVRNRAALDPLFKEHKVDAVLHLAGAKAVAESVAQPLVYFGNNVGGAVTFYPRDGGGGSPVPGIQLVGDRIRGADRNAVTRRSAYRHANQSLRPLQADGGGDIARCAASR